MYVYMYMCTSKVIWWDKIPDDLFVDCRFVLGGFHFHRQAIVALQGVSVLLNPRRAGDRLRTTDYAVAKINERSNKNNSGWAGLPTSA